jgi:2-dehydropantoate 2-reductase
VHLSADRPEPGTARLLAARRLVVGDPDGSTSERLAIVAGLLSAAGLVVEVSSRIQADVWFKLWGNLTMNPISMMTGATTDRILGDDLVRGFVATVMTDARALGDAIGTPIEQSIDDRLAVTGLLGSMRTSMLQDADAGRAVELDALVGAVHELGRAVGVPTPSVDALLGLARLTARTRGLYPG